MWQKIPSASCFETLRHPQMSRAQMIVMNSSAFLVTSASETERLLNNLPEEVTIEISSSNPRAMCLSFNQAIAEKMHFAVKKMKPKKPVSLAKSMPTFEAYDYLSWELGMEKGFNVTFETFGTLVGDKTSNSSAKTGKCN